MGLDNRDYIQQSSYDDGYSGSTVRAPKSIVVKLIIVTVAAFLLQWLFADDDGMSPFTEWCRLDQFAVFRGQVWRLVTYAFCHDRYELFHIGLNMFLLYILGRPVLQLIKEREFLWFYLAAAAFAGICALCFNMMIGIPSSVVGASGAVCAVFVVLAMHYPRQKMLLFGVIGIELRWLLAFYVAIDALPALWMLIQGREELIAQRAREAMEAVRTGKPMAAQTAHSAHLGGLLFGFLYVRWNMQLTRWWDEFAGRIKRPARNRSNLKVYNPQNQPDVDLSDRVDEILEKISREGESSLSARERRILTQASEQLKNRR